jgi:hypothetical protein
MKIRMLLLAVFVVVSFGCDNRPRYAPPVQQQVTTTTTSAPSTVMNASDFDLATVSGLIRDGKVSDAESLQNAVNDPNAGINNVDLDKDGNVDPITVTEVQTANGKQFDLIANPSNGDPTPIANINISVQNNVSTVQAGYPSYVYGYQDTAYSYQTANNLAFLLWALSPRPVFIPRPYLSYGWHPWHRYGTDEVVRRRTTYDTRMHVSPIERRSPSPEVIERDRARRLPSTFQRSDTRPAPTTNNLRDRNVARDFSVRDSAKPVQRATGFGAPAAKPAPATPSRGGASFGSPSRSPRVSTSSKRK